MNPDGTSHKIRTWEESWCEFVDECGERRADDCLLPVDCVLDERVAAEELRAALVHTHSIPGVLLTLLGAVAGGEDYSKGRARRMKYIEIVSRPGMVVVT